MIRCLLVLIFWMLTGGIFDINIRWSDGYSISLMGWPGALTRYWRNKK